MTSRVVEIVYTGTNRPDGLSLAEGEVMDALTAAAEAYNELEVQHPSEVGEFFLGIHIAQDQLATRAMRRLYPEGWPTYEG